MQINGRISYTGCVLCKNFDPYFTLLQLEKKKIREKIWIIFFLFSTLKKIIENFVLSQKNKEKNILC